MSRTILLGTLLCAIAAGVLGGAPALPARALAVSGTPGPTPQATVAGLDPQALLQAVWRQYKADFIQGDGRVIDHYRNDVSTSEGESYALLRAVWMNDKPEFDLIWTWTHYNLQVRGDNLFGFLWGHHGNQWSIIDKHSATDADEDIALALIFAGRVWHVDNYTTTGLAVIRDIWSHDVAWVKHQPYLTAGDWARATKKPGPVLNPSYLAPYEYRIFAQVDPQDPWGHLVTSSYKVLAACSRSRLTASRSVDLPPNWCAVSRPTGKIVAAQHMQGDADYGYDAFRVMWRLALDWEWNHASAAKKYLQSSSFLRNQWKQRHTLFAQYRHDGTVKLKREDPTLYGGDIGNFVVTDPKLAQTVARKKLDALYHPNGNAGYFDQRYNYYEQNWVWFGLALVNHQLPDLYDAKGS